MWYSFALITLVGLAPGEAAQLTVAHVHPTYGVLGPPRAETKFLPGDELVLSFDLEGVQPNAAGKVLYAIGMDVSDQQGKLIFKQIPRDLEASAPPAGKPLPAYARVQIGLDQEPGAYTVKVQITDRITGASKEFTQRCQVLPKAFGLVRLTTTSDAEGTAPAATLQAGRPAWINFSAVGFGRDQSSGQPRLRVVLQVVDDAGRPVLAKPSLGEITKDVPTGTRAVPMQFALMISRAGSFRAELTATDEITKQNVRLALPLTVTKAKE